jgi:hypothetical protein
LGVSEATVVRWECAEGISDPRGLQAVLIRALAEAETRHSPERITAIVQSCTVNHQAALKVLLDAAEANEQPTTA